MPSEESGGSEAGRFNSVGVEEPFISECDRRRCGPEQSLVPRNSTNMSILMEPIKTLL